LCLAQAMPASLGDDSDFPDCHNSVVLPNQHMTSRVAAEGKRESTELSLALGYLSAALLVAQSCHEP
jgi:hypothetical protein